MISSPESQADSGPSTFDAGRIADVLTRERLAKYLTRTGNDARRALTLYAWNQEIGAALTVTLSQVEVCLRNQVSLALSDAYGAAWHRAVKLRNAHPVVQNELAKAEDRLAKAVPTVPDIIAASDFNL